MATKRLERGERPKVSEAQRHRDSIQARRDAIAAYGLPPEPEVCSPGDRYAATTGEFLKWVAAGERASKTPQQT